MTDTAIIFDCEFLTAPGAPQRFWCGPEDPDPTIVQIGAVKIEVTQDAEIVEEFECLVSPKDRTGNPVMLSELFTRLTGISQEQVDKKGRPLAEGLAAFEAFSGGAHFWSWGKDEFNLLAISCYVAGIAAPIPVTRFGNAASLVRLAGVAPEDIHTLRSNTITDFFDLPRPERPGHDALGDAQSVTLVLQHLIRTKKLPAKALLAAGA